MDYQLDHNSSVPLHVQAEEFIRNMINQEEYRKGKLLPNEVELSQKLDISRNTLRQAINKLVNEGLLVRKKGVGTTVASQNVMSNARNWKSFSQEMRSLGMKVQNFELHISYRPAPEEALKFFGIKDLPKEPIHVTGNTSYLAMSTLIGRVLANNYFGADGGSVPLEDLVRDLPETNPVSENGQSVVLTYRGNDYIRQKGGEWRPYPRER